MLDVAATPQPGPAPPRGVEVTHVFRHEPDLLRGLDPDTAEQLAAQAVARRVWLEPGPWRPPTDPRRVAGCLGLLVLDGALVRCVSFAGRTYPELVGPGDLLRPWDHDAETASVPHDSEWRVLVPSTVAVLDRRFAVVAGRYPTVMSQLLARSTLRSRGLAFSLTLAQVRHAETRLLVLLWHLADRWGRMTPDGALVPLPLTHELLAHLVCLRRPTASTALQALRRAGRIERCEDGGWLLHGEPPVVGARHGKGAAALAAA